MGVKDVVPTVLHDVPEGSRETSPDDVATNSVSLAPTLPPTASATQSEAPTFDSRVHVAPPFVERDTSPLRVSARSAPLRAIAIAAQSEAPTLPTALHDAPLDAEAYTVPVSPSAKRVPAVRPGVSEMTSGSAILPFTLHAIPLLVDSKTVPAFVTA